MSISKDDYAEAAKIVNRLQSVHEIEDLTMYPVPRGNNTGKLMDEYYLETISDPAIQALKKAIGSKRMQKAWAKECRTPAGFVKLAALFSEAQLTFLYEGLAYRSAGREEGMIRLFARGRITMQEMAELLSGLDASSDLVFSVRGQVLWAEKVTILGPEAVSITLAAAGRDGAEKEE